jgi:hypothetical protein
MLEDLADAIEGASIAWRGGTPALYLGTLPEDPSRAVALLETPGRPAERTMADPRAIEQPRVAVWCRADDYPAARALVESVYALFAETSNAAVGDGRYLGLLALQPPFLVERDARGRVILGFNAQVKGSPGT